eukprot:CAMPEP_0197653022 /NCGR_PEP_ID=MMETSP1338-20131121/34801_1 /TAXON_ID=43686 ORGANISM="Pelagodinium beii, Strain RCC1491" /NCGR_SAMPLE_ID=MMETSP1338 /ASSEMBLY_ACC=CAM_ASM_000754 /LENGTH=119 /DNA_ID=CAMNT_0043228013 /DNA_START=201 /DNA_END=561 /DNA_ORIENTATION=-
MKAHGLQARHACRAEPLLGSSGEPSTAPLGIVSWLPSIDPDPPDALVESLGSSGFWGIWGIWKWPGGASGCNGRRPGPMIAQPAAQAIPLRVAALALAAAWHRGAGKENRHSACAVKVA